MKKRWTAFLAAACMAVMMSATAYADIPALSGENSAEGMSASAAAAAAANKAMESKDSVSSAGTEAAAGSKQTSSGDGMDKNLSPFAAMENAKRLARVNGMSITYQMPDGSTEVLDSTTLAGWVTGVDGTTVNVDAAKVQAYVAQLASRIDTQGGVQRWHSADGKDKSVQTTYGWKVNQAAECAALIQNIQALTSVTREPMYSMHAVQAAMPQFGTSFVEVDLASQHAYLYQNMQVIWDSPIVSGTATDPERATPTGVYSLSYKQTDRVLKGKMDPKTKKPIYESHVDFWMPFNGSIGLHDATWRNKFGGSIYQKNGSHGCINLPHDKAAALYSLIQKGTIVVVV